MNEQQIALRIKNELDLASRELPTSVQTRLHAARQLALQKQVTQLGLLSAAGIGRVLDDHLRSWATPLASAVALALLVAIGSHMTAVQQIDEIEELDSALLSDDLPIDAYLDSGFVACLRDSRG